MKARILDPQVKIYSSMDANSVSIATLPAGSEIEFGAAKRQAGKLWVPITLSTGQQAFIPGETRIYVIQLGTLLQDNIDLHAEASAESLVKMQLARNTKFHILQVIKGGQKQWVKIRDMTGNEGYIAGDTRIRVSQQKTKAMGIKNIRSGVMWLIAGLIITFSGSTSTPGSFYSLFGYVAILFGVVMAVLGLIQYLKAPS
jgi:hypothetical protein